MERRRSFSIPRSEALVVEAEESEAPWERSVILAELRELAELHLAGDLDWFKERFPNVWPRPMRQLELFR